MIRALRLLRHAWRLAEAEYALHRLEAEMDCLEVGHGGRLCVRCERAAALRDRVRSARSAYLALRGPR